MANKKHQGKKHKFKYAEPSGVTTGTVSTQAAAVTATSSERQAAVTAAIGARDFSYVGGDLRRVAILAVALVALEAVLWYLFGHTSVGDSVYKLINV